MNYDFSIINDKEFEVLIADLLSDSLGVRVERFGAGRDSGIDGRFYKAKEKAIIQCKHYPKTPLSTMFRKLENEEFKRVKALNPDRYIFVTSKSLSPKNKEKLLEIFKPYLKREDDIYGKEEVDDLLSKNHQVERKHFKLWINSTNVLNTLLNYDIIGRSKFTLEQIHKKSRIYYPTINHKEAFKKLLKNKVLIISGEPGIGKTTLAENLCLQVVAEGYEFVEIIDEIQEAENLFLPEKKQIFFYDDFLGSNYLEAISHKKDSHIINFIKRVKLSKNKLFILTSRTNILNSGIHFSSAFSVNRIRNNEYMIKISQLERIDKANILYNHIWFSNLSDEFIDEIYKRKRYLEILRHKNFNPRIIQFITDYDRILEISPSQYWDYILETLNNPKDIWEHSFKVQSNEFVRNLVLLTVFNGGRIKEEVLNSAYLKIADLERLANHTNTEKDFKSMIKIAVKSFLNREKREIETYYTLFNPSITDFVLCEYLSNTRKLSNIFKSLGTISSLSHLASLRYRHKISGISQIENTLFDNAVRNEGNLDYFLLIAKWLMYQENKKEEIVAVLKGCVKENKLVSDLGDFISLVVHFFNDLEIEDLDFLYSNLCHHSPSEYDFIQIGELFSLYEDFDEIFYKVEELLVEYLSNNIENYIQEIDISNFVNFVPTYGYDEYLGDEIEVNEDGIIAELEKSVSNDLNCCTSSFPCIVDVDINAIVSEINIERLTQRYVEGFSDDYKERYYEEKFSSNQFKKPDIDDLFDRS